MGKEDDFEKFEESLVTALGAISSLDFSVPVASDDPAEERRAVRERLFCYELYHQLRVAFEEVRKAEGMERYWLAGELDKKGHPIILKDVIPDLVVHRPGEMDGNLCVMEVKAAKSDDAEGFKKDIRTLTDFVGDYGYHRGIFLVFGQGGSKELVEKMTGETVEVLRQRGILVRLKQRADGPVEKL